MPESPTWPACLHGSCLDVSLLVYSGLIISVLLGALYRVTKVSARRTGCLCSSAQPLLHQLVLYLTRALCAEAKEAHRQEELEGKALKVNPTLKHLVRRRSPADTLRPGARAQGHAKRSCTSRCRSHMLSLPACLQAVVCCWRCGTNAKHCACQVAAVAPCLASPPDACASGERKQGLHEE